MANVLSLVNGIPRTIQVSETSPVIYDQTITVVESSPGANEILGPVTTGTDITLPNSQTYEGLELEVWLNGQRLEDSFDYNYIGSIPRTDLEFTFDLVVGDEIRFRIDRTP